MNALSEKLKKEMLVQLQQDLLTGSNGTLQNPAKTGFLRSTLTRYFSHLRERLPKANSFTYLNLLEFGIDDLSLYGDMLMEYIRKDANNSLRIEPSTIANYEELLRKYLDFIPKNLVILRNKLLEIRAVQLKHTTANTSDCQVDYTMVTYEEVKVT